MSKLLIHEPPLQVLPSLAVKVGLNEAIFLQQLHYWLEIARQPKAKTGKFADDSWWVFNSVAEWKETNFPFWSVSTIKRVIKSLEKKKFIKSRADLNKVGFDKTKWYTIDYVKLETANRLGHNEPTIGSEWTNDDTNLTQPIPETPTETTTDINTPPPKNSNSNGKPPLDPVEHMLQFQSSGVSEETGPNPNDQWVQSSIKAEQIHATYNGGKPPNTAQRETLVILAEKTPIDLELLKKSYIEAGSNWTGTSTHPPLARVIEVYKVGGDYKKLKWPDKEETDGRKPTDIELSPEKQAAADWLNEQYG